MEYIHTYIQKIRVCPHQIFMMTESLLKQLLKSGNETICSNSDGKYLPQIEFSGNKEFIRKMGFEQDYRIFTIKTRSVFRKFILEVGYY